MKLKLFFLFIAYYWIQMVSAQTFTEKDGTIFEDVKLSSIAFSDVDGDNDQDVLITGGNNLGIPISKLYINDGIGNFTEKMGTPFEGVQFSSIAFLDVDGDNDQDVLITGRNSSIIPISKLYINDGIGNFTEKLGTPFEEVYFSSIAYSDVDGDDDQDILITGNKPSGRFSKLYTNDGMGNFTEMMGTPFEGVNLSSVAFSDVDGDSDQDILITGQSSGSNRISKLYTNDGMGNFTEKIGTHFEDVGFSSVAFSDVDKDNDQDVLITGGNSSTGTPISKLYINDGIGNFTEKEGTPFESVWYSNIAFTDVDGDSDQDVLITGRNSSLISISKLYTNDGMGNFVEIMDTPFEGVNRSAIAFSDIDGDNDQDVLITGGNSSGISTSKLYTNNMMVSTGDDVSEESNFKFTLYPNPSGADNIYVDYISDKDGKLTVKIFDLNGLKLRQQKARLIIGKKTFSVDISSLQKGSYIIQLDDGKRKGVHKFLIH